MKIKSIWILFRFLPVFSWSFSAVILGLSIVVYHLDWVEVIPGHLFLVVLSAALLQGIIAHAYNDLIDWETGTDQHSPGILSGGSKVIPKELIREEDLSYIAKWSIITVVIIAIYFMITIGYEVLLFLFIGLWAAITYSCAPLRFAYRPWLGEWLCAWPAMLTCTVGTSYILSKGILFRESIIFGMIHATFSIAWLMLHHIPDIEADIRANPPKWTTIAYIKVKSGWAGVLGVIKSYLFLTFIIAVIGGLILRKKEIMLISGSLLALVFYLIQKTKLEQVDSVTRTEIFTIVLTIVNAFGISSVLIF